MTRLYLIILLLWSFSNALFSQDKGDFFWVFGYSNEAPPEEDPNDIYGASVIYFPDYQSHISQLSGTLDMHRGNASICDDAGNLLFYTNGKTVATAEHDTMVNGNLLTPFCCSGSPGSTIEQGVIILPMPGVPKKYCIITAGRRVLTPPGGTTTIGGFNVYNTLVDMALQDGKGEVVEKNTLILEDTLDVGKLTAVRHANGRDWWILVAEFDSPRLFPILLDPSGFRVLEPIILEEGPLKHGVGQTVFSPDGRFFVYLNLFDFGENYLNIFDFDRCTGTVSNHRKKQFSNVDAAGGVAVSPNSRYLYYIAYQRIYQYDLWAEDILASETTVALYDGYQEPIIGFDSLAFNTHFYLGQLAPDGRIYINNTNGVRSLHVIENPDEPGEACGVKQHSFWLPTYNRFSLPNFPNYRLGPIDGSPCDTLGINNVPVARFRYAADSLDYRSIVFHDLSFREPETWLWDFGDGNGSTDRHPTHSYAEDGLYEVCLTVSNVNGEHTECRSLLIGTVATEEPESGSQVAIFPNPAHNELNLLLPEDTREGMLTIFDLAGRQLKRTYPVAGINVLDVSDLPKGVFLIEIRFENEVVTRKFVKQ
ncbi:MAG: PKD domain-containing protein [Saprospiraceae bacterium]